MPPKVKVNRDDIVNAAVEIIRSRGENAINARTIAAKLDCSTQPIFSNFTTMDELRLAVTQKADALYNTYLQREVDDGKYPAYKARGMAYIRFAQEEKELFKLLFMRNRTNTDDHYGDDSFQTTISFVQAYTGLNEADATMFHLELWAVVHGIATMFATGFLDLDWALVSKMISDAYFGLRKQYGME